MRSIIVIASILLILFVSLGSSQSVGATSTARPPVSLPAAP